MIPRLFNLEQLDRVLANSQPVPLCGHVETLKGLLAVAHLPGAAIGQQVLMGSGEDKMTGEVVGFENDRCLVMPYSYPEGLRAGARVEIRPLGHRVGVGLGFVGRSVDAFGKPIDGGPPVLAARQRSLRGRAPNPLQRARITEPISVGIRAIDGLITLGKGQRVGIFAGSGVGKSTLMGMMARNAECDVVVIGLIGERGREVRSFIEEDLGPEGQARSALVVATGDRSPLERIRAAELAVTIAEDLRDRGQNVLFLMDSVTRYAHARRELGLAAGELPATRGYPPSVFTALPGLLERLGNSDSSGSLTALITVLVEGDDLDEPVSDTVRGVLDGHIVLSRTLAEEGHWPAVDVGASLSRLARSVRGQEQQQAAETFRQVQARYQATADLVRLGAYARGSDPFVDYYLEHESDFRAFLQQGVVEDQSFQDTQAQLQQLVSEAP
ncbi:MAG TPA: hypothetical protein DEB46_07505 [Myxococcales bacterium]|nr:hypothetical protein [Myxococcales bacterium]|tara:strand:+ start:486 stop:1811 length:1326 start_codon:yes stop_codon:yes gene_type:complete